MLSNYYLLYLFMRVFVLTVRFFSYFGEPVCKFACNITCILSVGLCTKLRWQINYTLQVLFVVNNYKRKQQKSFKISASTVTNTIVSATHAQYGKIPKLGAQIGTTTKHWTPNNLMRSWILPENVKLSFTGKRNASQWILMEIFRTDLKIKNKLIVAEPEQALDLHRFPKSIWHSGILMESFFSSLVTSFFFPLGLLRISLSLTFSLVLSSLIKRICGIYLLCSD